MTFAALIIFFSSLVGIILLFTVKRIEASRETRFADGLRTRADVGALRIKAFIHRTEYYAEHTPWFLSALTRYGVHVGALAFARLARASAEQAHHLADLVSHKHRFERKETKSQYLREVGEYKNGKNGDNGGVAV